MEPLSRALRKSGPYPPWPKVLQDALGHELDHAGYVFRLQDGTTVHVGGVNQKHGPGNVTVYRGYVEQPDGTRRDLADRGEDFPVEDITEAWKEDEGLT